MNSPVPQNPYPTNDNSDQHYMMKQMTFSPNPEVKSNLNVMKKIERDHENFLLPPNDLLKPLIEPESEFPSDQYVPPQTNFGAGGHDIYRNASYNQIVEQIRLNNVEQDENDGVLDRRF